MRTLGFRTHVLLAVAAAIGLIAALGRPWYAQSPQALETASTGLGTFDAAHGLREGVERLVTESTGTLGWDALGTWGTVLSALAALTALGAMGCLVPGVQGVARELLRYGALACFVIVAWKLVDPPGAATDLELRYGAVAAAGAALVACTSGAAVAAAPIKRTRA
jgi:hypothetical protein